MANDDVAAQLHLLQIQCNFNKYWANISNATMAELDLYESKKTSTVAVIWIITYNFVYSVSVSDFTAFTEIIDIP